MSAGRRLSAATPSVPMPRLRTLHVVGVGVDHMPVDALPEEAFLCNVYEHDHGNADHVALVLLALTRDLPGLDRRMRVGDLSRELFRPDGMVRELSGSTMGALGMDVAALRSPRQEAPPTEDVGEVVGPEGLDGLLAVSDVRFSMQPHTDSMEELVSSRCFWRGDRHQPWS